MDKWMIDAIAREREELRASEERLPQWLVDSLSREQQAAQPRTPDTRDFSASNE
jgi:hypothetical protein